jgi:hypothetical protein
VRRRAGAWGTVTQRLVPGFDPLSGSSRIQPMRHAGSGVQALSPFVCVGSAGRSRGLFWRPRRRTVKSAFAWRLIDQKVPTGDMLAVPKRASGADATRLSAPRPEAGIHVDTDYYGQGERGPPDLPKSTTGRFLQIGSWPDPVRSAVEQISIFRTRMAPLSAGHTRRRQPVSLNQASRPTHHPRRSLKLKPSASTHVIR